MSRSGKMPITVPPFSFAPRADAAMTPVLRRLLPVPVQLKGPQAVEVDDQVFLAGKIIEERRLGNLYAFAQGLDGQGFEGSRFQGVGRCLRQRQAGPGELLFAQRGSLQRIHIIEEYPIILYLHNKKTIN